jgi:hypothetical protein
VAVYLIAEHSLNNIELAAIVELGLDDPDDNKFFDGFHKACIMSHF